MHLSYVRRDIMKQQNSRFGLDLDLMADDFGFSSEPELEIPITHGEDEEPIGPQDIAAQTASLIAQEKAEEAVYEQMDAPQRIDALMGQMPTRRKDLLTIMALCQEPTSFEQVEQAVGKVQKTNASVFTSANLCALLEKAGALERVLEDGTPYPTESFEPRVVEDEQGNKHLEAVEAPAVYWVSTQAANDAVAADDPQGRLDALLEEDEKYLPIYTRVLKMTSEPDGATTKALGDAVDKDPLVQEPRYFAMHFTERLEKADAVEWTGKVWAATELGRNTLEKLDARMEA